MLAFHQFQKRYGGHLALEIPEMTIDSGIYWLKGANGSGKSTLLKAIAGLLSFEGQIRLSPDIYLKKQPVAYRKIVNFAEAEPLFPEFLTGQEMIRMFVTAKSASPGQEQYYLESMQMQHYINQPVSTYSSGMLKKLSLVLAFIGQPKLILLDEPLITIDSDSLQVLYRWIVEKHQKDGTGFLLASHQALEHDTLSKAQVLLVENLTLNTSC
ncbi:ABC transporter ATP-binding protein [Pedobacter caeni]|uniref:ABC-2 type transport system ATP-binding protein n=1 Tax=Pedobacter caeni TaxID=288992 RepID=A0A1M5EZ03_9SPHI|nr:ATP-binding cassette domain-containing protein [Pedobacter caeni]SHF84505.1 ABC-2 type transport system ATP-binding protein [Pedobacter caeni]